MGEIEGLIARVEGATGADRELDADIIAALGFHAWAGRMSYPMGDGRWFDFGASCITDSTDAALALKDRVLPGQAAAMGDMAFTNHPRGPWATIWTLEGEPKWNAEAATLPLAIVLATLRALSSTASTGTT